MSSSIEWKANFLTKSSARLKSVWALTREPAWKPWGYQGQKTTATGGIISYISHVWPRFNVLVKPDLFCSFCEKLLAEQARHCCDSFYNSCWLTMRFWVYLCVWSNHGSFPRTQRPLSLGFAHLHLSPLLMWKPGTFRIFSCLAQESIESSLWLCCEVHQEISRCVVQSECAQSSWFFWQIHTWLMA